MQTNRRVHQAYTTWDVITAVRVYTQATVNTALTRSTDLALTLNL